MSYFRQSFRSDMPMRENRQSALCFLVDRMPQGHATRSQTLTSDMERTAPSISSVIKAS